MAGVFTRWTSANHHSKKIVWFFFVYASSTYMNFGEIWNKASLTFYILTTLFHYHHLFLCCSFWCCVFVCVSVCFQQQYILIKNKVDVVSRSFISFHFIQFLFGFLFVRIWYTSMWRYHIVPCGSLFIIFRVCLICCVCVRVYVFSVSMHSLPSFRSFFLSSILSNTYKRTHTKRCTHVRMYASNSEI